MEQHGKFGHRSNLLHRPDQSGRHRPSQGTAGCMYTGLRAVGIVTRIRRRFPYRARAGSLEQTVVCFYDAHNDVYTISVMFGEFLRKI